MILGRVVGVTNTVGVGVGTSSMVDPVSLSGDGVDVISSGAVVATGAGGIAPGFTGGSGAGGTGDGGNGGVGGGEGVADGASS